MLIGNAGRSRRSIARTLKGSCILITGCGALGSELVEQLLSFDVKAVRVLDNSERALFKARTRFDDKRLRYLLGDIRNPDRVSMAMSGADLVIHTAAIKSVDIAHDNPLETVDVNVQGTFNIIKSAMAERPSKVLAISSDKSILSEGAGVYHASKFILEEVIRWANQHSSESKFSIVRPANFVSGVDDMSVFEIWKKKWDERKPIPVTDWGARRFFIPIQRAARYVLLSLAIMKGGEIFIPPAKEYKMVDLAKRLGRGFQIVGLRPQDRISEKLMAPEEMRIAKRMRGMWVLAS